MPVFKVGDRVRVVKAMPGWRAWNDRLEQYIGNGADYPVDMVGVHTDLFGEWYRLPIGDFPVESLSAVPVAAPVVQEWQVVDRLAEVGEKVRVINDEAVPLQKYRIKKGAILTVKRVTAKAYAFEGYDISVLHHRFETVVPANAKKARKKKVYRDFQVGDKVLIVAKVENLNGRFMSWNGTMDKLLNDGVVREVVKIREDDGCIRVGAWLYLPECLKFADKNIVYRVPKAKKPKKPAKAKSLRAELLKKQAAEGLTFTSSFALEFEDGHQKFYVSQVCHYGLRNTYASKVTKVADNIQNALRHVGPAGSAEMKRYHAYVNYLVQCSPWSVCYEKTTASKAIRYGLYMDVSKPGDWIGGACIAMREGTEYSRTLSTFDMLLKKGYSGHTAFIVSRMFAKGAKEGEYSYTEIGHNHASLHYNMDYRALLRFFAKGYVLREGQLPYSEAHRGFAAWESIAPYHGHKAKTVRLCDVVSPFKVTKQAGDGWNKRSYIEEASVLALADKIEADIKAIV